MGIKMNHQKPGRIPTAKGSIRHKSKKDYKRKKKIKVVECLCGHFESCENCNPYYERPTWKCECHSINDTDMFTCRMCGLRKDQQ